MQDVLEISTVKRIYCPQIACDDIMVERTFISLFPQKPKSTQVICCCLDQGRTVYVYVKIRKAGVEVGTVELQVYPCPNGGLSHNGLYGKSRWSIPQYEITVQQGCIIVKPFLLQGERKRLHVKVIFFQGRIRNDGRDGNLLVGINEQGS